MKLFSRTVAGTTHPVGAWMEDKGLPEDVMYAELLNMLNRQYYDFKNIHIVRKTPAEIGGVFESFGTYGIKAYANKRGLLSRIKQRLCADAPITDKED